MLPEPPASSSSQAFFALAVDPIDPNIVYAGEGFFRYDASTNYTISEIWRSTNLGDTWSDLGIEHEFVFRNCAIHSIVPHAYNGNLNHPGADTLYVSASGTVGVWRGAWTGSTWTWTSLNGSGVTGLPHKDACDLEATLTGSGLNRLYVVLDSKWDGSDPSSIYDRELGYGGGVWFTSNRGATWNPTSEDGDALELDDTYADPKNGVDPFVKNMRNLALNKNTGKIYVALSNARWAHQGVWRGTEGDPWTWEILTEHRIGTEGQWDGTPHENFNFERTYMPNLAGCEGLDILPSGKILFTSSMHTWLCEDEELDCIPTDPDASDWQSLDTAETPHGSLQWTTTGMDDTQAFDITVDPQNSQNWYMGLGDVGLLRSTNAGGTWQPCIAEAPYDAHDYRNCWKIFPVPGLGQWIGVFGSWSSEGTAEQDFNVWWTDDTPPDSDSDWHMIEFPGDPDADYKINDVIAVYNDLFGTAMMAVATETGIFKSNWDPLFGGGNWADLTEWMQGVDDEPPSPVFSSLASQVVTDPTGTSPNRRFVAAFRQEGGPGGTELGKIYYSTSFGATWQPANLGTPPMGEEDCLNSIWSLEWSNSDSQVIHAGSGNPHGCYLKSTDKGANWNYVSDFDAYGQVSVVDLVETKSSSHTVYAAIQPLRYGDNLEVSFGGVFYLNGSIWSPFKNGLDAGHMTFLKEDGTQSGRFFAGTMGNGAYKYQPPVPREMASLSTTLAKVEQAQPSLRGVQSSNRPGSAAQSVRFVVGAKVPVTVSIYGTTGRLVRLLMKEQVYAEGAHTVTWDGLDDSGHRAPSGIYYARVSTPIESETVKFVMVR